MHHDNLPFKNGSFGQNPRVILDANDHVILDSFGLRGVNDTGIFLVRAANCHYKFIEVVEEAVGLLLKSKMIDNPDWIMWIEDMIGVMELAKNGNTTAGKFRAEFSSEFRKAFGRDY